MDSHKRLKDPIYGYIDIPISFMNNIIDTAVFQRLRRIIQTSYSPLYSSAVHNRFVHSLGVYHLGRMASYQLEQEVRAKCDDVLPADILTRIGEVFRLACLLHDVGHAPFSHTGEEFYLDSPGDYRGLHEQLVQTVGRDSFADAVPVEASQSAAPHEIMSAIIGLKNFERYFKDAEEKEFFACCITGYQYKGSDDTAAIKNCFILLLNSKVIDVDKLDYLIRDAYITGFDTVKIDYQRLLSSLTITSCKGKWGLAYYKGAVSVLENVVYAHDAERKWIQNHPVVLYESYILKHIILLLNEKMDDGEKRLFSLASLGEDGQCFGHEKTIRLLCDDDIIYLAKNVYRDRLCDEYFNRSKRMHPIWKSEAEYNAYFPAFIGEGELMERFNEFMTETAKSLAADTALWVIDDKLLQRVKQELKELQELQKVKIQKLESAAMRAQLKKKQGMAAVLQCLKDYAEERHISYRFVVLAIKPFNSGFSKLDFSEIGIIFGRGAAERTAKFGKIAASLQGKNSDSGNYFYLFYERIGGEDVELDKADLCHRLYDAVMKSF